MNCTCVSVYCTCSQWHTYAQMIHSYHYNQSPQSSCTCHCSPQSASHSSPLLPSHSPHRHYQCNTSPDNQTYQPANTEPPTKRRKPKLSMVSESSEALSDDLPSSNESMSEQFKDFILQSSTHRTQVKTERDNTSRVQLEKINYEMNDHVDRRKCMEELYGPFYNEVASLEAKLSLRYETYCDENQPVLWPVLPLKL